MALNWFRPGSDRFALIAIGLALAELERQTRRGVGVGRSHCDAGLLRAQHLDGIHAHGTPRR